MASPKDHHRSLLRAPRTSAPRSDAGGPRVRDDSGISLVEVLVAFVVLIITVVPLTYVLNSALVGAANARQRQAALQLADSWIEILSNSTPPTRSDGTIWTGVAVDPTAPAGAITPKSTLAGTNYTVKATYSFQAVNQSGQSDLCTDEEPPSPSHPGVIQLQVKVTWNGGRQALTDTTNINYPRPGLQTQGFLAVQVTNDGAPDTFGNTAAARLQAVPITVTGGGLGSPLTVYPDNRGCAFTQIPQGTYNVQVGQPSGGSVPGFSGTPAFVDPNGNTSVTFPGEQVAVTAETTVAVTFDWGIKTSVSYGGSTAVDGPVECPGAAGLTCLVLGNGPSKASAAWGDNGSTWSSTALSGTTTLSQVGCTTGVTPTCVGVGENVNGGTSTGVILTTASDLGSVRVDPVPAGITDVTQVACPSANGCYAIGSSASGPVLLAGAVGQSLPLLDTWAPVSDSSSTFTSLSSIACVPGTTTCMVGESASVGGGAATPGIMRVDGDPSALAGNAGWTPTFTLEGPPPGLQSVGTITCPTSTTCLATAVGDSTSASDPTILGTSVANTGPDSWTNESTFPTGAGSVTGLSCGTNDCVAIGTAAGQPAVWTGDLTSSPHDWAQVANGANGIPASVSAVTAVSCGKPSGGDLADCVVAATASTQAVPGELLEGSLTGSWSWNPTTAATSSPVLFYSGVACEPAGASGSVCAAAGSTPDGPVVVTTSRPNNASWSERTPASLPGATVTGIPLETSPATLSAWTTQVTQAQAAGGNATSLPNVLYPLASGYSIVAGDCPAAATPSSIGSLAAPAGGTASVTVPLGLLPLRVVAPLGTPVSGATVALTSTTCPSDSYALPTTDAQGLSSAALPYGTYTYSVNGTAVANTTIAVGTSSATVSVTSGGPTTTTQTYLPGPVPVPS